MIHDVTTISRADLPPASGPFLDDTTLLLDIETTGLSPAKHPVYCIGYAYLAGEEAVISLLFAENPAREKEILEAFSGIARRFSRTVTFNGTTFDLPFLKKRCAVHDLADPFSGMGSVDLYREALRLKSLLALPDYRQKTVEQFLGVARTDACSGRELIRVYQDYVKAPRQELLDLLLLHNRDDVRGMFGLLGLFSYRCFLDGGFLILSAKPELDSKAGQWFLNFFLRPDIPLPQSVRLFSPVGNLVLHKDRALLRLPVRFGTLKHYFTDYKNYYYLPEEDTVVHKSVGIYVDPQHRQKAARDNCYIKKECAYLCLPAACPDGYLKQDLRDPNTYFDLSGCLSFPADAKQTLPQESCENFRSFLMLYFQNCI